MFIFPSSKNNSFDVRRESFLFFTKMVLGIEIHFTYNVIFIKIILYKPL